MYFHVAWHVCSIDSQLRIISRRTGGAELLSVIRCAEGATLTDLEANVGTYQLRSYGGATVTPHPCGEAVSSYIIK